MQDVNIQNLFSRKRIEKVIIFLAFIVLVYLLCTLYFTHHFFFRTFINGADVSLKSYDDAERSIQNYIIDYRLRLKERDGETEEITAQEVGLELNEIETITEIYRAQQSFQWLKALFKDQRYYAEELYQYDSSMLTEVIDHLGCMNKTITEPESVKFKYFNGSYQLINEIYGNRLIKSRLYLAIKKYILKGKIMLDLNQCLCYRNPDFTVNSEKTKITRNLLNKYVSTHITYKFGNEKEVLSGDMINQWLSVDDNLEVIINKEAAVKYIKALSKKYDTAGATRKFKTSTGTTVEVKGGFYGWKIDKETEAKALLESIQKGEVLVKEPAYLQKALYRGGDEIGNTYIEINITKQHIWLYKEGKLITHGAVVTGNPNKGNATAKGTYMLNYKQKEATLKGPDYEVGVTYWMPFNGNMGIHDATWRRSFGGEIYKRRGTHGCVNAPPYLAKTIFENAEEGIPVVIYEE